MQVFDGVQAARAANVWPRCAIAIGNFDGVHLGHQALLAQARAVVPPGGRVVALTFDPHPSVVLAPQAARPALLSLARRCELLLAHGADAVVVERFDRAFAALTPEAFFSEVLGTGLRAAAVVVGHDFSYGARRAGSVATIAEHAATIGAVAHVVPAVRQQGVIASSTAIRDALQRGVPRDAARMLGRPFDLQGVVVHGAKRGREIGFPTANIASDIPMLLAPGIYAVRLRDLTTPNAPARDAVASFGTNPTFVAQGNLVFEVHVLDWQGDLYDRRVRVEILDRVRGEVAYTSVDALVAQIHADIAWARGVFAADGQ